MYTHISRWEIPQKDKPPLRPEGNPSQTPSPSSNQPPALTKPSLLTTTHFWWSMGGRGMGRKKNLYIFISHAEKKLSLTNKTEYKNQSNKFLHSNNHHGNKYPEKSDILLLDTSVSSFRLTSSSMKWFTSAENCWWISKTQQLWRTKTRNKKILYGISREHSVSSWKRTAF